MAEIIQRSAPDIIVLNAFDYVEKYEAIDLIRDNNLAVSQNEATDLAEYTCTAPSNTGVGPGSTSTTAERSAGPTMRSGSGVPRSGMVVLSRYPIIEDEVGTFQNLPWSSMPDARLPDYSATPERADWYSPEELEMIRPVRPRLGPPRCASRWLNLRRWISGLSGAQPH